MAKMAAVLRSEPTQARSREALERFIAAGEQALIDNQFEQLSIAELAAMADSSVGTFYRLFTDKEILFHFLHERFVLHAKALVDEALDENRWEAADIADILSELVHTLARLYGKKEGLLRALIIRCSSDVGFRKDIQGVNQHISNKLTPLLVSRMQEIGHPKPTEAIAFGINVVMGTMNHHTLAGLKNMSMKVLVRELTDVLLSYLRVVR